MIPSRSTLITGLADMQSAVSNEAPTSTLHDSTADAPVAAAASAPLPARDAAPLHPNHSITSAPDSVPPSLPVDARQTGAPIQSVTAPDIHVIFGRDSSIHITASRINNVISRSRIYDDDYGRDYDDEYHEADANDSINEFTWPAVGLPEMPENRTLFLPAASGPQIDSSNSSVVSLPMMSLNARRLNQLHAIIARSKRRVNQTRYLVVGVIVLLTLLSYISASLIMSEVFRYVSEKNVHDFALATVFLLLLDTILLLSLSTSWMDNNPYRNQDR